MKYFLKPGINFHLSRKLFIPFLAFLSSSLIAQYPERTFYITSDGDDDCSDMHCGLQAAFDSCANDSANYTLLLANGMYAGTYTLEPDSGYCYGDIFLDGGWDTDFSGKTEGHGTVIDGNGQGQPLRVNKYKGKSPGSITINGLKVINGYTEFPGGGMLIETFGYPITVNNCVVMNNQTWNDEAVGRSGGGIFTYSFNTSTNQGGKIIYTNNYIAGNKAGLGAAFGQGGGIFTYACDSLILINNCIVNNQALGSNGVGGGIELYSRGAVVLFINNVFTGNYAEISGGGTANHVTSPVSGSDFLYINNIIYGNSRGSGFGYGIDAYSAVKNVDDKLVTISYDHNIIGYHSTYPGTIEPVMTDNLNTDPVFVDSLYHIAPSSPAVDAGIDDNDRIPGSDFFGNQRIKFGKIDIGVHEQDGLVARYNLDGNAEDESPNGIDGYFYSAPGNGIKENIIGAAHIMLDTQRILIPHHRELNIPHELTISLWFNADNLDNPHTWSTKDIPVITTETSIYISEKEIPLVWILTVQPLAISTE